MKEKLNNLSELEEGLLPIKKKNVRDSGSKVHPEGRREAEWNYGFEQFANKMRSVNSDREILRAFADFKV